MADPLSISSGLIGGLSFAIQLCEGTMKYCAKFKNAPDEIFRMHTELDSFNKTVQTLERVISGRHFNPDIETDFERLISKARKDVDVLQEKLEKFWREGFEGFVQPASETDKDANEGRNQPSRATSMRDVKIKATARLKSHSHQIIDRAKYASRQEILEDLWNIIHNIKSDLGLIMSLFSISCYFYIPSKFQSPKLTRELNSDAANENSGGMTSLNDTMSEKFDLLHEDIKFLRDQENNASNRFRNQFDTLKSNLDSAKDQNSGYRNDILSKMESLEKRIEFSQAGFQYRTEKLVAKISEIDAKADRIGGAANGVTDQYNSKREQLIREIKSIEEFFLPKIDGVASDIKLLWTDMTRTVNETHVTVKATHEDLKARHDLEFLEWFSPLTTSFEETQRKAFGISYKQEDAAKAFLRSAEFLRWTEGSGRALWCLGGPGVGKTILASSIIDQLKKQKNHNRVLVYMYCNYSEAKQLTASEYAEKLLAHAVRQMAHNASTSYQAFAGFRERYVSSKASPSLVECREAMTIVAAEYGEIIMVLDGLDECPEESREVLFDEFENLEPKVRFLITSRYQFPDLFEPQVDTVYNIRALDSDIASYVKKRTRNFKKFMARIGDDKELQEKILNRIVERANGMFLLARLHVDSLIYKISVFDIEETLAGLPDSLSPTYEKVIERIEERDPYLASRAKKLITWIAFAETPLTVRELVHAIAVEPGDTCLTSTKVFHEATLLAICPELFDHNEKEHTLRFIHYSAQEHFAARFESGQSDLALTCLTYLSLEDFDKVTANCHDPCEIGDFMYDSMPTYTLLEYASCHWGHHAKRTEDACVRQCTYEFLEKTSRVLFALEVIGQSSCITQYFHYRNLDELYPPHKTHKSLGLWIAVYFEWYSLVVEYLNGPKQAGYLTYPYELAISKNYKDMMILFVQHGANVNKSDRDGTTALQRAVMQDDRAFALELVNKGADISINMGDHKRSALHIAAKSGKPKMVQFLLERGDASLLRAKGDSLGDTILHHAAMSASFDVIDMLVQDGAEVNAVNNGGETPLHVTFSGFQGHNPKTILDIMDLLIAKGAKVNAVDHEGRTVLHWAAHKGNVEALDRLLGYGASINTSDAENRTALWFAAKSGHRRATAFLIEHGAQVNTANYEKSALWEAVFGKHSDVVDILLQHDANVNQLGLQGDPILTRLIRYRILESKIAEQLLAAWADPNIKDRDGLTALDYASNLGPLALEEVLDEYGATKTGRIPYDPYQLEYKARATLSGLGGPKFRKDKGYQSLSSWSLSESTIERMCRG